MTHDVTFTVEINDIDYEVRADIEYHIEQNWGSDADGNRGMERGFFDGFKIDNIMNLDTQKEVEKTPELEAEIANYIAEHLADLVEV